MTRTARSVYPRAVNKDRLSKSGLDKSMRKDGAGPHNWGRLADERTLEDAGLRDEQQDLYNNAGVEDNDADSVQSVDSSDSSSKKSEQLTEGTADQHARDLEFRKGALKGSIDLLAIARSSGALSSSPPASTV